MFDSSVGKEKIVILHFKMVAEKNENENRHVEIKEILGGYQFIVCRPPWLAD